MSRHQSSIDELIDDQAAADEKKLAEKFGGLSDVPVLIVFGLLFCNVFLQFFTRYVLNDSLAWTEELSRYLLIILTFVGVIKCEQLDSHIRLEFVDSLVPKGVPFLKTVSALLSIFFFGFLTYSLYILTVQTSFQKMVSMPIPKYYFYGIILVSLATLVLLQTRFLFGKILGSK